MQFEEVPRPQRAFETETNAHAFIFEDFLRLRLPNVEFDTIRVVTDLFCGNGMLTLGSLALFPHAEIHAVDYHDVLVRDAKTSSRVRFHQGFVTDLLEAGDIPESDIVILSDISRLHGFTRDTIHLLKRCVGSGLLLTINDMENLDSERWFLDIFQRVYTFHDGFSANWIVKKEEA